MLLLFLCLLCMSRDAANCSPFLKENVCVILWTKEFYNNACLGLECMSQTPIQVTNRALEMHGHSCR